MINLIEEVSTESTYQFSAEAAIHGAAARNARRGVAPTTIRIADHRIMSIAISDRD